jgi:HEAT repeat protein
MGNEDVHVNKLEQRKDVPGLIEALKHPEEGMRIRAANALGRVGDERAIPALTAALHDEAATDPAELFRGSPAWEEMGSAALIYYVRKGRLGRTADDLEQSRHDLRGNPSGDESF